MTPQEAKTKVLRYLGDNPGLFAAVEEPDGRAAQLLERASGKVLTVRWDELAEVALRASELRPHPYLILLWQDGRQVALADVGFAFAPSIQSTGPLPDLPDVFCFRDFRHLASGAQSLLEQEGRELEALRALLLGIALLDGARAVGFDVSREERQLEVTLRELERRGIKPT
jgi:hypothetical protein